MIAPAWGGRKQTTTIVVPQTLPIVPYNDVFTLSSTLNQGELSGKKKGAMALVEKSDGSIALYVATGPNREDSWQEIGEQHVTDFGSLEGTILGLLGETEAHTDWLSSLQGDLSSLSTRVDALEASSVSTISNSDKLLVEHAKMESRLVSLEASLAESNAMNESLLRELSVLVNALGQQE